MATARGGQNENFSFPPSPSLLLYNHPSLAAFSLRAESSPFPPCRKERKPIKEKTTKKN